MPNIIISSVICPLCDNKMTRREIQYYGKRATLWFCKPCEIGCYDFDPAFNKCRDQDKEIPCPNCNGPLKWFVRYLDGFFKGFCPLCKCVVKKDGDVQLNKYGGLILPEETLPDEEKEKPVEIFIPVDKLKRIGKDKRNEIKNKIRRRHS